MDNGTKEFLDNGFHAGFLNYIITDKEAQKAFKEETGYDVNSLVGRSGIEQMIDEATGFQDNIMYHFIVWATETFWSKPEDAEHIEAYARAKSYLNKKATSEV